MTPKPKSVKASASGHPRLRLPLQVFDVGETIEVQDANGRVVIKWTGFEASDFGLTVQRRMACALVKVVNAEA